MHLRRLAAQPEPAVARLDELRFRLGFPSAQLMPQPVDLHPCQRQARRDARFTAIAGKATLLHRIRLAGRERNLALKHRLARHAFASRNFTETWRLLTVSLPKFTTRAPALNCCPAKTVKNSLPPSLRKTPRFIRASTWCKQLVTTGCR